eukprot:UN28115
MITVGCSADDSNFSWSLKDSKRPLKHLKNEKQIILKHTTSSTVKKMFLWLQDSKANPIDFDDLDDEEILELIEPAGRLHIDNLLREILIYLFTSYSDTILTGSEFEHPFSIRDRKEIGKWLTDKISKWLLYHNLRREFALKAWFRELPLDDLDELVQREDVQYFTPYGIPYIDDELLPKLVEVYETSILSEATNRQYLLGVIAINAVRNHKKKLINLYKVLFLNFCIHLPRRILTPH